MGYSEKLQIEGVGLESEGGGGGKKWVIAGIVAVRTTQQLQLRPIKTSKLDSSSYNNEGEEDEDEESTTPRAVESRIPDKLRCPPAPRKRRTPSRCNFNGVREFFSPPHDLESVFIRRPAC